MTMNFAYSYAWGKMKEGTRRSVPASLIHAGMCKAEGPQTKEEKQS